MPLANKFNKLSDRAKNSVFIFIMTILVGAVYNQGTKWLLNLDNKELKIRLKEKEIELERLKSQNMELRIQLIKCETQFNNMRANTDNLPLVYWEQSVKTGYIEYVNPAFERQVLKPLGLDKYDLLFRPLEDVFGDDASYYMESHIKVYRTGKEHTRIEPLHDTLGNKQLWRSTKFPIRENGVITRTGSFSYMLE